ncbi:ATP-dependent helicase HrpB [Paenibacillus cymbidii]|uniref:ATP-dependent helicase HrpB n=1 Tax=Paenibacillus cymbidii TaxID=1639034 RepID=UPI00108074CE|nr:ATP-dependent helicase HrpB [Paenibacillus cymbidii]
MTSLPIDTALPELRVALSAGPNAVLVAPPGAGKTTRVPPALLDEPWLAGRRIVMLEPRRVAARSAARFMAEARGEAVGGTIGYRVRGDTKVGPHTRIEVVTEGVLTRMLQSDQALEGVGVVLFDEFHERSLHADLGLALCLQAQALLRDDLRLVVMSATLDAEPVAALLGGAPIVRSEGRAYPVETRHLPRPRAAGRIEPAVAAAIASALAEEEGDVLAFLPGAGEIRRVQTQLAAMALPPHVSVLPFYGDLPQEAQERALAKAPTGQRKVVLATSIAETSLTVEGVRVVVDSGLMRIPRFSPRTGMSRLETVPVSLASADQRRGRAGRLGPGVCYRLWTAQEERALAPRGTPEIAEADLAPLALELAAWGAGDPAELAWLDAPPAAAYAQARGLLRQLGALDEAGALTPHGRRMAQLGAHPRLAHMLLRAAELGRGALACELAALLGERDPLRGETREADVRLRVEALRGRASGDAAALRRIQGEAAQLRRALGLPATGAASAADGCGSLLAFAFPDRIAQRRDDGRFLLSGGRGAVFAELQQLLAAAPYLVAAELEDSGAESRIYLAAPLEQDELEREHGERIAAEELVAWDRSAQAVRARKRLRLDALVLKETPLAQPDPQRVLDALLAGIAAEGLDMLPWTKPARQLQQRLQLMHAADPSWPAADDAALTAALTDWLAPHVAGMRSRDDLKRLALVDALGAMLTWAQRRELDAEAPTHVTVPSGSRIAVDYGDPAAPKLAVRLQELFGLADTPRIGRGRVPLTLQLLSPAQRPVQVTRDLASFWREAYFEVRKDLKGRYPKHYWPDDPLQAEPTSRSRPRPSS